MKSIKKDMYHSRDRTVFKKKKINELEDPVFNDFFTDDLIELKILQMPTLQSIFKKMMSPLQSVKLQQLKLNIKKILKGLLSWEQYVLFSNRIISKAFKVYIKKENKYLFKNIKKFLIYSLPLA